MKKYIIPILFCVAGLSFAATAVQNNNKAEENKEKKALPNGFYAGLQEVKSSVYPRRVIAGSPDGIPYGLRLDEVKDRSVSISWNSPEATDGYFEDFEGHDNFAINSPGTIGWSYIDGDNKNTYSWQQCTFQNQGQKMAFIIMNPKETVPSVDGHPYFYPISGDKMLVCMGSVDAVNNDWIISPELSFDEDFRFSFYARSYRSENIPLERIRVGYSTNGKTQSSFKMVTPSPYLELPAEWKLYEYIIPREAKYVCINCVSDDAFMLLIDDIMIGTNEVRPGIQERPARVKGRHLIGFNVYRDGVKVNSEPVTSVRYTDKADSYAVHSYTVSALYSDGTESAKSEPLSVDVRDPRILPFEDDFDDWTLHEDKWYVPENPAGVENYWGIDYYTYGLIDPSATYSYSSLRDYDQSLITRELRTLDKASTYLRFDLRLCNWGVYPEEENKLDLQITCDGGNTWTTIDTYDNLKGELPWTQKDYSLASYLTSDCFQLRWRAYGKYAMHIDYWYVDDVKVWNPKWGSLRMNVQGAGGNITNTPVTLTDAAGAKYEITTDASGVATLGKIEAGTYSVCIVKGGYNPYLGTLSITEGQTANVNVHLTQPVLSLSANTVHKDMAVEDVTTDQFTISNTGDGPLTWRMHYAPVKQSGKGIDFQIHNAWNASGDLQTSIAFDGEYYYTTSWYYLGEFWKYDREGNLIEQFRIPDMYYKLYDLAYDGRYFYGSDYSNRLFQLDFDNKRIVGTIEVTNAPDLKITHVAYNPNNDRFYVGSWNTLTEIRRNGRATSMDAPFDAETTHNIYGSAYDNVTPGGPYLWLSAVESYNENMLDKVVIYQYSLATKKFTGFRKVVTDVPGYKVGTILSGTNYICGIEGSYDIEAGKFTLIGALQQSPCLFFEYNIAECDSWLDFQPRKATILPGESTTVDVTFNARNAEVGKSYSSAITLNTVPELAKQTITLGYTATKASETPRPLSLQAAMGDGYDKVLLTWQKPALDPQGYNIYRNGSLIASDVKGTTYTDTKVVRGKYSYTVTALYQKGESVASDKADITVQRGAPYYAPVGLTSTISANKTVVLNWQNPQNNVEWSGVITYASGEHKDQLGLTQGGSFYVGHLWDAESLVPYRNKVITDASIQIINPVTYLALCVFKDGERIVRQSFDGDIVYGSWNTITLDSPITIEPGSDYIIGFMVEHTVGMQPVGVDGAETAEGKGNLLSTDGEYWFPATQMAIDGNINIRTSLLASDVAEAAPVGYNVYCNGSKVNAQTISSTAYTEDITTAGTYTYTVTSVYADGGESSPSESTSVEVVGITQRYAPTDVASDVERNRNVSIYWGFPIQGKSTFPVNIRPHVTTSNPANPTYVGSFMAQGGELAIASDCKYIYTSTHTDDGRINQYDLNGNFIRHFYFKGIDGVRNITYDGQNFWLATASTYIYKVDMESQQILEEKPISEYARHFTYVPDLDGGKGGFEVGDWETSIYVTRQGAKLGNGPTLTGSAGTAYYDGRLYSFEQGGINAHTIAIYDFQTCKRIGQIDLEDYDGLSNVESAVAGGMSIINTPEGLTFLAIAAQNTLSTTEFIFLDIASVAGVEGYNVYRNGKVVNSQVLTQRYFTETLQKEGDYDYQLQTVYIDGTVSELSAPERVTIVPVGTALAPAELKVHPTTYGYDVAVSFADPDFANTVQEFQSFEGLTFASNANVRGWTNGGSLWKVTDDSYHGERALMAERSGDSYLIIPTSGMGWMSFVARNSDDHLGSGSLQLFASQDGDISNFILVDEYSTAERWQQYEALLPEGTQYVMLYKKDGVQQQFLDAVRLNPARPADKVWGYDVFRDGKMLNAEPIRDISFIDHNLVPGKYTYQVRQQSVTGAISPLSGTVTLNLDYSNGGQAPENLEVMSYTESEAHLQWRAPALGDAVNLKWHTGNCYDAAGLPSGGAFYAAVRWAAKEIKDYAHLSLSEVEVYVNQVPDALYVLVYQGSSLVHRQYVPKLRQYSFNTIKLDKNIPMDVTKELRVVVYVEHNEVTVPLGYDEGPAHTGRGNLYSKDGISYTTMNDEDTGIDCNWNITIGLRPYVDAAMAPRRQDVEGTNVPVRMFPAEISLEDVPTSGQTPVAGSGETFRHERAGMRVSSNINTFEGYNVYSNSRQMNTAPIQDTRFTVEDNYLMYPYYQFKVSAVYSQLGEVFGNTASIAPTETAVESVDAQNKNTVELYDLQGRRVVGKPQFKGIFIHGDRKVSIK